MNYETRFIPSRNVLDMLKRTYFLTPSAALLLTSLPLLMACNRLWSAIEPISGNGTIVSVARPVQAFDACEFDGAYAVILTQGATASLTIETDSNLLPFIKTEIKSGKLLVSSEGNLHPTKDIILHITSPTFRSIEVDGSAEVHAETPITSNELELAINGSGTYDLEVHVKKLISTIDGSGKYILRGVAESHTVDISGAGDIFADSMQSQSTKVSISGSGQAAVRVSRELDAKVEGSGHVRYHGSVSELHTSISGSGSVEKLEN